MKAEGRRQNELMEYWSRAVLGVNINIVCLVDWYNKKKSVFIKKRSNWKQERKILLQIIFRTTGLEAAALQAHTLINDSLIESSFSYICPNNKFTWLIKCHLCHKMCISISGGVSIEQVCYWHG